MKRRESRVQGGQAPIPGILFFLGGKFLCQPLDMRATITTHGHHLPQYCWSELFRNLTDDDVTITIIVSFPRSFELRRISMRNFDFGVSGETLVLHPRITSPNAADP